MQPLIPLRCAVDESGEFHLNHAWHINRARLLFVRHDITDWIAAAAELAGAAATRAVDWAAELIGLATALHQHAEAGRRPMLAASPRRIRAPDPELDPMCPSTEFPLVAPEKQWLAADWLQPSPETLLPAPAAPFAPRRFLHADCWHAPQRCRCQPQDCQRHSPGLLSLRRSRSPSDRWVGGSLRN